MALLTDKNTTKTLENRLNEFQEYATTLYYLFEEGRTNLTDLSNLFFSKDEEKTIFTYSKIMKHIKPVDIEYSLKKYSENYPNNDRDNLNKIYTKKILDLVIESKSTLIDKTYVNTYNYLLTNQK